MLTKLPNPAKQRKRKKVKDLTKRAALSCLLPRILKYLHPALHRDTKPCVTLSKSSLAASAFPQQVYLWAPSWPCRDQPCSQRLCAPVWQRAAGDFTPHFPVFTAGLQRGLSAQESSSPWCYGGTWHLGKWARCFELRRLTASPAPGCLPCTRSSSLYFCFSAA